MSDYLKYLNSKLHYKAEYGFKSNWIPTALYDFQAFLVEWALLKGRAAIFADCGLGKTFMQLTWAQNIINQYNKRGLILAPLAVGQQTVLEGEKIGVDVVERRTGINSADKLVITNYERLHYFNPNDFNFLVCDESSILKNFDGTTRQAITEFMRKVPYRLLCTATAAPNDFTELGTSSEAIGELGYSDMLSRFFKRDNNFYRNTFRGGETYRLRGHAEQDFWRWVCSWSRALRKPSDLGFTDNGFSLPELLTKEHIIQAKNPTPGLLFDMEATDLFAQRESLRRTLQERCQKAAELINSHNEPAIAWCNLNDESILLQKIIPGSVNIQGKDSEEKKEEAFYSFVKGDIRVIITKPTIAGFGLNWQHCGHQTYFPSHSYEQYYQSVRRSWRFGRKYPVNVDIIMTDSQVPILKNLKFKSEQAERMFNNLVLHMKNELNITDNRIFNQKELIPEWL